MKKEMVSIKLNTQKLSRTAQEELSPTCIALFHEHLKGQMCFMELKTNTKHTHSTFRYKLEMLERYLKERVDNFTKMMAWNKKGQLK